MVMELLPSPAMRSGGGSFSGGVAADMLDIPAMACAAACGVAAQIVPMSAEKIIPAMKLRIPTSSITWTVIPNIEASALAERRLR
jgi:acyl-coenzyme A thioesterase PaaI-like protein